MTDHQILFATLIVTILGTAGTLYLTHVGNQHFAAQNRIMVDQGGGQASQTYRPPKWPIWTMLGLVLLVWAAVAYDIYERDYRVPEPQQSGSSDLTHFQNELALKAKEINGLKAKLRAADDTIDQLRADEVAAKTKRSSVVDYLEQHSDCKECSALAADLAMAKFQTQSAGDVLRELTNEFTSRRPLPPQGSEAWNQVMLEAAKQRQIIDDDLAREVSTQKTVTECLVKYKENLESLR